MHPAFSVIFFTVSSGLGYGLLALIGVHRALGLLPPGRVFGLTVIGLALALVTAGLLSSTVHLGHPERAWRAFSQWRTSWLSREGIAAVVTYIPACALAAAWMWPDQFSGIGSVAGWTSAVMAIVTVFCTAMIYRSLATIHEWANGWTLINYLSLALAGGVVWMTALMTAFGIRFNTMALASVAALILAWICKRAYWRFIDTTRHTSTLETATGLGTFGKVRVFEPPHTEDNYLLKEMGYQVGRRHAVKLRHYAQSLAFALPGILLLTATALDGTPAVWLTGAASLSITAGLLIERWLVFAQARHVVSLYYGRTGA